jgi:peroxiredoxin
VPVSVGEKLPDIWLKAVIGGEAKSVTTGELFAGNKVVLFGVPGAFTPTCSNSHLPGFVENYDAIRSRGVDAIAVVSTNDHHVMAAWARFTGAENKFIFLADGNGEFTRAIGTEIDMSKGGLGVRTARYSMIVEDGVVKQFNSGDMPGQAVESGAARILEQL